MVPSYLHTVRRLKPYDRMALIDERNVIKPDEKQFEVLGIVRDGSKSTQKKSVMIE